ncbi:XRE family transcriptional regulator [Streptomyces sp. NPDC058220]|uniref:XRE family transcriptional regulator n=1 Tax=Streptomyces sp. NPDC058220 TaxID=3346387 RepID=UPI0036E31505
MEENESLNRAMQECGYTQAGLADAVNAHLRSLGHEGTVSDRTVRNWTTGKSRWPHPRQRDALEAVFGRTADEVGFSPPAGRRSPSTDPEQPVRRRNFVTAAAGTAAAVVPLVAPRPTMVGTTDVIRLRRGLDELVSLDQSRGGHGELECLALNGAEQTLDMQRRATSQRIRQRLFAVAADYTGTAAWSALDARQFDRAQVHLEKSLYLAGMAQDPVALFDVWNMYAILARQRQDFPRAVDAAYAAQATTITRRDPMFASLAHARAAIGHSNLGDKQAALRSLGYAQEALGKATPDEPRPSWIAFYGPAELSAMTAIVRDDVGDPVESEAASHKALSQIPEQFRRNRALATAQLALAQLHQRDIEQACSTADKVFDLMTGNPLPGRMRSLLGDFYRDLITLAPDAAVAREWGDRYRLEWSRE